MQPDRWFGVASAEGTDAGARAAADGYGEIARTRGARGFHNQTVVVLSIA